VARRAASAVDKVKAAIVEFVDYVTEHEPGTRIYTAWQFSRRPDIRLNTSAGRRNVLAARSQPGPGSSPGRAAVTGGLIAPVIPSGSRQPRHGHGTPGRPGAASPLPLAGSPPRSPALPAGVVYGIGRIDASGRVADRTITSVLGWRSGDRLTLTAGAGVVVVRRDPQGMVTVPARPYIVIPAALRHCCDLRAGDRVLLAAMPGEDTLTAYSFAVVDQAIRARAALPADEGSCS
jgi:hypothetical protein